MKKSIITLIALLTTIFLFVVCQSNETCQRYCLTAMINSADLAESLTSLNRVGSGIAELVTERRNGRNARFLRKFDNNIGSVTSNLTKTVREWSLSWYLVGFQNLDDKIATEFLNRGEHAYVTQYLTRYDDLSDNTATRLIEDGYGRDVALHTSSFGELDEGTVYRLIETGNGKFLTERITALTEDLDIDPVRIVNGFFDVDDHESVAYILPNLEVDHQWVADRIITAQKLPVLGRNIPNFRDLNSETAVILANAGFGDTVIENAYLSFVRLNSRAAEALIVNGNVKEVAEFLEAFEELDDTVAKMLINAPDGNTYAGMVARKLGRLFRGLSAETAQELIRRGYQREVQENSSIFSMQTVDTHQPSVSIASEN